MATLGDLEAAGALIQIEVSLDHGDQSWRRLYATPDFIRWLNDTLPNLTTTIVGGDSEPDEQVDAIFHEYVIGDTLSPSRKFKRLRRSPDLAVWELKTPDIRIFGWVPERDVFICAFGEHKDQIELLNAYGRFMAQTDFVRAHLDLDEPKAITGKGYEDVLSDAS